ncbi:MAG: recombinase family protein [Pseudomonadota bacterium]
MRPALQEALRRLESGAAAGLLVTKLDRLTRSVRDLGDLVDSLLQHTLFPAFGERFHRHAQRSGSARPKRACFRVTVGKRGYRRAYT